MYEPIEPSLPANFVLVMRTSRIIVFALILGVTTFGGFVMFRKTPPANPNAGAPAPHAGPAARDEWAVPVIPVVFAVGCVFAAAMVPSFVVKGQRNLIARGEWKMAENARDNLPPPDDDAGKLMLAFQTSTIIRCALLEGPLFFCLFMYMSQGSLPSLILAGLLWLGLVAQFPRSGAVRAWLATQLHMIVNERSLLGLERESKSTD